MYDALKDTIFKLDEEKARIRIGKYKCMYKDPNTGETRHVLDEYCVKVLGNPIKQRGSKFGQNFSIQHNKYDFNTNKFFINFL